MGNLAGFFNVDALASPVAAHVGVDNPRGAVGFAALREFHGVHRRRFFPAFDGDFAAASIDTDDDFFWKVLAERAQQFRIIVSGRADNHPRHAEIQRCLYGDHGTQPAAQLHRQGRLFADRFHLTRVYGAAFHRAIEINDVDERRTFLHPVTRRVQRTLEVDGLFVHVALKQTHTTAVLDIDCRNNEHGAND